MMNNDATDWPAWIRLMEQVLEVPLDDARRAELEVQLARIAAMAQPLMQFPLPPRQEGAGEYRL
ncbi:oxalurate catabolism protein HpxX [Kosakonia cowanii]|uniref:oxalurate catabolism protein HpxX n=1 Tax=Kosakonia cowanii TaxID=208223 RepID=UPI003D982891